MDFGYKVIRNRLGSLVANAIQKKIDSNNKETIIVVTVICKDGNYNVNVNSSDIINAITSDKPALYILVNKDENIVYILSEFMLADEYMVYINSHHLLRHLQPLFVV